VTLGVLLIDIWLEDRETWSKTFRRQRNMRQM